MRRNRAVAVGDEIRRVVSTLVSMELKDPRIPVLTSITEVKMSPDLRYATCYVSVYGSEQERRECLEALRHASGFIRREVCARVQLRIAPEFRFEEDDSMEESQRLSDLIRHTKDKESEE